MKDIKPTTPEQDIDIFRASRKIGAVVTVERQESLLVKSGDEKPLKEGAIAGASVAIKTLIECGIEIPEDVLKSTKFAHTVGQVAYLEAEDALDQLHLQSF